METDQVGGAAEFSFARGGLNRWLRVSNDPPLTKLSFQTYCRSKCFILKFIVSSYQILNLFIQRNILI